MQVHELEVLIEALKDSGYGGYKVLISSSEPGYSEIISTVIIDVARHVLLIQGGSNDRESI